MGLRTVGITRAEISWVYLGYYPHSLRSVSFFVSHRSFPIFGNASALFFPILGKQFD